MVQVTLTDYELLTYLTPRVGHIRVALLFRVVRVGLAPSVAHIVYETVTLLGKEKECKIYFITPGLYFIYFMLFFPIWQENRYHHY